MLFTRTQKILLAIELVGFAGAIGLLFTAVPFWIPALLVSAAYGLGLGLMLHVSREYR
jgi:hypothetical protein